MTNCYKLIMQIDWRFSGSEASCLCITRSFPLSLPLVCVPDLFFEFLFFYRSSLFVSFFQQTGTFSQKIINRAEEAPIIAIIMAIWWILLYVLNIYVGLRRAAAAQIVAHFLLLFFSHPGAMFATLITWHFSLCLRLVLCVCVQLKSHK